MAEFDLNEYFNKRFASAPLSKQASITQALEDKLAGLREYQKAAIQGKTFQDPERTVGDVLQDAGTVAVKGAIGLPQAFVGIADIPTGGHAGKFLEEELGYRPGDTKAITDSWYSDAQKEANFRVEREDGFVNTLKEALDNPSTIATSVGESLPQIVGGAAIARGLLGFGAKAVGSAAGGVGPALPGVLARTVGGNAAPLVAGAMGEGALGAGAAAEQLRDTTKDGLLSFKQVAAAVGSGAGTALLGLVGGKLAQKAGLSDVDTMLASGKLGGNPAGFVKAVLGSGISEGVFEEMPQSAQEQMWSNFALDKPLLEGVGDASAMGLLSGMAMGHAAGGLGAAGNLALKAGTDKPAKEPFKGADKLQEEAITTGDVSALVDPKAKSYAPDRAIAALVGHNKLETTTPEARQANVVKAGEIVTGLEEQHEAKQDEYAAATVDGNKSRIASRQADIAAADPADTRRLEQLQLSLDMMNEDLAALNGKDHKDAKLVKDQLVKMGSDLAAAQVAKEQMDALETGAPADVDAHIAVISKPVAAEDVQGSTAVKTSVDAVMNLAMRSPQLMDPVKALALASDAANALSDAQRKYLRAFSALEIEATRIKGLDGVNQDIFTGSNEAGKKRFIGIAEYRTKMAEAVTKGNQSQGDTVLGMLGKFAADHGNKAKAARAAMTKGWGTQILRSKNQGGQTGEWYVNQDAPLSKEGLDKNGGLTMKSGKLVQQIEDGAKALSLAHDELLAAYATKFSKTSTSTTGATDVKNAPRQETGTPKQVRVPAAKATEAAGNTGKAIEGVPATRSVPDVEADGVTTVKNTITTEKTVATEEAPASSVKTEESKTAVETKTVEKTETIVEENQSNKNTTEVTELTEADSPLLQQTGELSALAQKSPEGTSYQAQNLLAEHFTQTAGREGDKTLRPLVAVKDFLSAVRQKTASVLQYLGNKKLTDPQEKVLQLFSKAATKWQATIEANLVLKPNAAYYFQDLMQFLQHMTVDGQPDLEENIKTAMSYAAFSWTAENAMRPNFNGKEEINTILERDENAPVTFREQEILGRVGDRQNVVINTLGQRALAALGLKANKDAPLDLMPRLESALGAHIMKMMVDNGILEPQTVSGKLMAELTQSENTETNASFNFLRLARDKDFKLNAQAEQIALATKGTQGMLDKLFSVESSLKEPSLEPVPMVQKTTRNTKQGIPSKLREIVARENAVASYVHQDKWKLFGGLDRSISLQIAGAVSVDPTEAHKSIRTAMEAKNDGLGREIDRFMDFVGLMDDPEAGMYFDHSVWKQHRVGIATNAINPQSSKVHRHLLFQKSWETEVTIDDDAQLENFLLRVGEGLGVKTDKKSNATNLPIIQKKIMDPVIAAAIDVLVAAPKDKTLTAEQQDILLAGVKAGGEDMHSFDALVALAEWRKAGLAKEATFTTHLMGEVDGVTNGPMLSHLLMGAAATVKDLFGVLNRGGFYQVGSGDTNYNLWREAVGHFDLYETTALHMTQSVRQFIKHGVFGSGDKRILSGERVGLVMGAIYAFTGELADKDGTVQKAGRNIIKTPLTAMVFGSSVKSAVESMANNFIESVYAEMADVRTSKSKTSRVDLLGNINILLSQAGSPMVASTLGAKDIQELMEFEFSKEQLDGLQKSFKNTLGKAVAATMEEDFSTFISQRMQFNAAAQMAFELYNATYTGLREELITQLVASGELGVDGKGIPLHDLTEKQEAGLRKRLEAMTPIMHTAMSKQSGELKSGLYMAKTAKKLSQKSTHRSSIKFGTAVKGEQVWSPKQKGYIDKTSLSINAFETIETPPGVAMLPMGAHSFDSAAMHSSIGDTEVVNVHDAKVVGLSGFIQAAQSLNKATWDTALHYSLPGEMFEALSRTIHGLAALAREGNLPAGVITNLADALKAFAAKNEVSADTVLADIVQQTKTMAFRADTIKLGVQAETAVVDQYALQGGQYEVTPENRAEAAALLAGLDKELSAEIVTSISEVTALLGNALTGKLPIIKLDIEADTKPAPAKVSPFGPLGKSQTVSDKDLVAFFKANPEPTVERVIEGLYRKYNKDAALPNQAFNMKLLKMLRKLVDPGLKIKYITRDTPATEGMGKPPTAARGWYAMRTTASEIYVLSPDFVHSGLTPEVLLHELTHAALGQTIEAVLAKKEFTEEAQELVTELKVLMDKARKVASDRGVLGEYAAALGVFDKPDDASALHEFITWGMTNQGFQTDVLNHVSMTSKTWGNKLVSGMQSFIRSLAGLLSLGMSKSQVAEAQDGLGILVSNVSGLFLRAKQANIEAGLNMNLAMASQAKEVDATGKPKVFYHGTRAADEVLIRADGSLVLKPSKNYGGKTLGVSFTDDINSATDYATRIKGGGPNGFTFKGAKLLKIRGDALTGIEQEFMGEWADYSGKEVVIPKGQYTIEPVARERAFFSDSHLQAGFKEWFNDNYSENDREEIYQLDDWKGDYQEHYLDEIVDSGEYSAEDTAEAKAILRDQFGRGRTTNLAMASPTAALNKYSTLDLHEALDDGKTSPAFDAHLRGLLGGIVEKLHGPFGSFKAALMEQQALSPTDVWLKALNTGVAPFASQILASPVPVSQQEAFAIEQVEATVRAALADTEAHSKFAYKELSDLYTEVHDKLNPDGREFHTGDWSIATPSEKALAKSRYDFVFKLDKANGDKSDYLARFAALGLAHEGFRAILAMPTEVRAKTVKNESFADRLQRWFEDALVFLQSKLTHTYRGQAANSKLSALVSHLVDIEAKKRHKLAHPAKNNFVEPVEAGVKKLADSARQKISDLAGSGFIRNNRYPVVRAVGALTKTVADDQVEYFLDNMRKIRNAGFKGPLGVTAALLQELKGQAVNLQTMLRMSKKREGDRKDIITDASKAGRWAFVNKGKALTREISAGISAVFLRTGAHYLVDKFTLLEIEELVSSKTARDAAIAVWEAKLGGFSAAMQHYFIEQSNVLAYQKATGSVRDQMQMMNAHNISRMYGTVYHSRITPAQSAQSKEVVEVLVALYAMSYSDSVHLTNAYKAIHAENARKDGGNGVEFAMKLHKHLEAESLERLFKGNPALMMHGYTPEIYNPHVDVVTANLVEGKDLTDRGYVKGDRVVPDPADPNREVKHLYTLKDGGLTARQTGIVSTKSLNSKGSEKHNGYLNVNTAAGMDNAIMNAAIAAQRQAAIGRLFVPGPRRDLSKITTNYMAPVLNERGDVVKWRYLMNEGTKDVLLDRDNSFDKLLGVMAGSIFDKETTRDQNKEAMVALKEQYDADWAKNPEAYIRVGQDSKDKEMKEIWDLLPDDTKADVKAIWGQAGMMVRNDTLDIMFGYRKLSMGTLFKTAIDERKKNADRSALGLTLSPSELNALERVFVEVIETVFAQYGTIRHGLTRDQAKDYAKRAAVAVTRGERMWQEIVSETKDILVVKTGLVMMGNIWSNLSMLAFNGVPLKDILHHHLVALKGATAYKRDTEELAQLILLRDADHMGSRDVVIARKIIRLEDAIARNPVKKLIDAGLMPTIVEDLTEDEDLYSYKSAFTRKVASATASLNPSIVSAAKVVYMSHDTKMYQGLSRITQLSDFVARYTLYQHNISKKDPMTPADALQDASDSFVNYDIPMHRALQYTDDMGITMFTKYFLRIQKVLNKLMKDHPGRVISAMVVNHFMELGPIVLDSSMWGRIGNNPLQSGAFKYITSLDDLATVNAVLKVFK